MSNRYQQAGVNLDAGAQAVSLMKAAVQSTFTPEVLSNVGNFGGLFDVSALKSMHAPVLVASTDGVGTKTRVAARMNRWDTIGQDLVNHCINDILVQGAKPLFFLDYVASDRLQPEQIAVIVGGMAEACRAAGCALIGGETAEMPGIYSTGEIDVVGTIIGVVDRAEIIDGKRIQPGDVILGLPSTGLHTNGFSLVREVLQSLDWNETHPQLGISPGEAMLAVHRCYVEAITELRISGIDIRGLAHITGGGIIDNLPRIL
ncbi:MAG TPA: phosphoribosylformylglycinamidine cyclo-ligase, partial [Aggregatilineales bacterium]|nr:phosphoribosylformylglycinamidine cyclo-ligase [Aggregatilineales bacterium]